MALTYGRRQGWRIFHLIHNSLEHHNLVGWFIQRSNQTLSFPFILGPLHWSSIIPKSKKHMQADMYYSRPRVKQKMKDSLNIWRQRQRQRQSADRITETLLVCYNFGILYLKVLARKGTVLGRRKVCRFYALQEMSLERYKWLVKRQPVGDKLFSTFGKYAPRLNIYGTYLNPWADLEIMTLRLWYLSSMKVTCFHLLI